MTATTALTELMSRAGASDTDRPAWLAERAQGVTATDIRDLYTRKITIQRLVAQKRAADTPDLGSIPAIAWGKTREPILAAYARDAFGLSHESRAFHASDEPRFLCSPDLLGENFDLELRGGEIKTGIHPAEDALASYRYDIQCHWSMRVTGAARWLFLYEQRHGDEPGEITTVWIDRDDDLIGELESLAHDALVALDVTEPARVDLALAELVAYYETTRAAAAEADEALRAYLAEHDIQSADLPNYSVSFRPSEPGKRFDASRFKAEHPDLHAAYMKLGKPGAPSLRVTPKKEKAA